MKTDYRAKARNARLSLMSNGALCALTWTPPSTDTGPRPTVPAAVTYSAYGVIFDYTRPQGIGVQADSMIEAGDRQLLLSVFNEPSITELPEPPFGARLIGPDGETYTVAGVKTLAPAGVRVLYEINVRR